MIIYRRFLVATYVGFFLACVTTGLSAAETVALVSESLTSVEIDDCTICHDPLVDRSDVVFFNEGSGCSHRFHKPCINEWLTRSRTCPLCRARYYMSAADLDAWLSRALGRRPKGCLGFLRKLFL